MDDLCERCGWPKNPLQLGTLEYYGITIQACFPCIAKIAGLIKYIPLDERIHELRKRKEDWRRGREERERRAS